MHVTVWQLIDLAVQGAVFGSIVTMAVSSVLMDREDRRRRQR